MLKKIEHHLNLPALTFLEAGKEDCVPYNMWGPGEREPHPDCWTEEIQIR